MGNARYLGAFIGGGILGAAVSWVVNCTLVEISLSTFFAFVRCARPPARSAPTPPPL